MNLSAPFIRRPVMTTFVMLAILIAGYMAFRSLPVSDLPTIDKPHMGVKAFYTGATPDTMVDLVTIPLEKELMNIHGLKEISSNTTRGQTTIDLTFDFGKNLDEAAREIQESLNRVQGYLPHDMEHKPYYYKNEAHSEHIMYLVLTSAASSIAELRDYSDVYIQQRLARIEGVSSVDTFGSPYAVRIKLNPELMAARKIALNQVLYAIKQYNTEMPLGVIKTGTRMLTLEMHGKLQNAKDFGNLIVADGPVRLQDIAEVTDGAESEMEFHFVTRDDNTLALILGVKKMSGANTVSISNAVRQILPQIQKDLPPSMHFELWFDKAVWIHESIMDVEWSLIFAFALVVIVIFFSLGRLSEAMIPSVALPMSLIGTFVAMHFLHFSLDLLSLLALTLSVGFVVDDAIVVLENIVRHSEKGEKPMEASLLGSKEICFTVLSMTLSLVAVFIPLLFMGGMNGLLFREFSITLAVAILVSGFISLTLTPMLCSRFLSKHQQETRLQQNVNRVNRRMVGWYDVSLRWCINHPKTLLLLAAACFALTVPLFQRLPVNLFPEEDRGFVWGAVNLPKGISNSNFTVYQHKIEKILQDNPNVESFVDLRWDNSAVFLLRLLPPAMRPKQSQIIQEIQSGINAIPGTQTFLMALQLINMEVDMGSGGNYQFVVRGMEFKEVEEAAEALKKRMQEDSLFPFVNLNLKNDEPKLVVKVDDDQAQRLGIAKKDVQSLLQQAFSGGSVGSIYKAGTQYKVYLELAQEYQNNPAALGKLYFKTGRGEAVPLKSLATWHETLGSPALYRIDQLPAITVNFAMDKGVPLNQGLDKLEKIAKETLPSRVSGSLKGAAAMIASTVKDTSFLLLASVLVMYIVLGILYESFIHPLTILSSLPFAGLGGILTLMLFGEPLSLFSMVGFLLLIGIVKKNGIMMIDYALEAQKRGLTPEAAIVEGCLVRFRPIMMTTIAAIMGAVPIAIGFGEGSEMRRGLGLVIVGGLLFSQLLTLYVTPVLFLTMERMRKLRWSKPVLNTES